MKKTRRSFRYSYLVSIFIAFGLVFSIILYMTSRDSSNLSGQATADVNECVLAWSYYDESTSEYSAIITTSDEGYIAVVDERNRDIECVDPTTGKQRRAFKNGIQTVSDGYYVGNGIVRFLDIDDKDYIDLNVRSCLEIDRDSMSAIPYAEDYHDVMYSDNDYYIDVDVNNKVRIYAWDKEHAKDVKFTFSNAGLSVLSLKVDPTGYRYLIVWADGSVVEYKIDDTYSFYEKIEWYTQGALDAEFSSQEGVVVVTMEGKIHYLKSGTSGVLEYKLNDLGKTLEGFSIVEFDLAMGSKGVDDTTLLFSLHPESTAVGRIVKVTCK